MQKEAPESVGQEQIDEDNPLADLEGEDLYKEEFKQDTKLVETYGSIEAYVGYKKAEAAGRIKQLKKK